MRDHLSAPAVRRALRLLAVLPAIAVLLSAGSAAAEAPASWDETPAVSPLHVLLLLVVVPVGLFALITLLVMVPSMSKTNHYAPGQAWTHDAEWFGGPREGVDELEAGAPALEAGRETDAGEGAAVTRPGGASGRW